jgi:hypothetical protein
MRKKFNLGGLRMMMPNPDAPECECTTFRWMTSQPDFPISYDAELNEYHIVGAGDAKVMIYHCFFCGGRMPHSRRESLFHHLSEEEVQRLRDLTKPLNTVAAVIAAFGEPETDDPQGTTVMMPEHMGTPRTDVYRTLTYSNLSAAVLVQVIVGTDSAVRFSLVPKPLSDAAH